MIDFLLYELAYLILIVLYFCYEYCAKGISDALPHLDLIDALDNDVNCIFVIMLLAFGILIWPVYVVGLVIYTIAKILIKIIKEWLDEVIKEAKKK